MSAETIETLNTSTLIGYADKRGKAWHYREAAQGAETNHYDGAIPIEDVRRRLFAWEARETSMTYRAGGRQMTDKARKVIFRSDTGAALGVFGRGYQIHQFDEWLTRNFEAIIDDDLQIGSAGVLRGGAWAWVQIESPDTREVAGVQHRPFLLGATSHDGYLSTTFQRATQLVVCDNTLQLARREADRGQSAAVRIRHSSGSLGRLTDVREALGLVIAAGDAFEAEVEALVAEKVDQDRWAAFTSAYLDLNDDMSKLARTLGDKKREQLDSLWETDERVTPWRGTAFGVVQAVNTWNHHVSAVRGGGSPESRNLTRAITGEVSKMDQHTLRVLAGV